MTPQQRTREFYQKQGYLVGTVEQIKYMPESDKKPCEHCGIQPRFLFRSDLFGFADVIAIHPNQPEVLLLQATTGPNHSARKLKILGSMEAKLCLMAKVKIVVQSWDQDAEGRWHHREEFIRIEEYKQAFNYPNDVRTLLEIKRKARRPDLPAGSSLPFVSAEETPF